MDPFFLFSLAFVLLYFSLYLIFVILKGNYSNKHTNLPPGSSGWPILGENMDMASSPEKFIHERMKKHSSQVFKTSLLGEKIVVFCGSSGNKFLFSNENKLLGTWWPQSFTKPLMCPTQSQNTVKRFAIINRVLLHEILKPENLKQFIPFMDSMARDHLSQEWLPFKEVKIYPLAKKYTFTLACKLFLSIEDFQHVKKLLDPFVLVTSGMYSVPINFPGTPYNRAIKGGKMAREEFLRVIRERKKETMEKKNYEKSYNDLLSRLMSSSDENGQLMNDADICNIIMGLLTASYHTTSGAITFVLKYLAELPKIFNEVYKEQMEIAKSKAGEELLNWDDIQKMKYSWNVACEALRLMPPAQGAFREAITDFTFGGFTIPKGWKTFWNVYSTHTNPKYFPEPEKFDPCRFEGSGPAPYTFVPFGGGPKMCPGKEYARLEILVFMHNVVTKFKLEKLVPNEEIIYQASPVPANGLPVRIQPYGN
ncbi:beta-amyrin 6-beta-monooxygenase-like [Lycium ferocissimum]|uniref:beta-amyrin 6-beta-monooxygenase-like n=1 Tax=Lycium ferocissimum TaxID=112874 RepID=UPI0028159276|nr:beta-amyrin 6-beta-monooxygenase-like [Lycium ferocissimum]